MNSKEKWNDNFSKNSNEIFGNEDVISQLDTWLEDYQTKKKQPRYTAREIQIVSRLYRCKKNQKKISLLARPQQDRRTIVTQ